MFLRSGILVLLGLTCVSIGASASAQTHTHTLKSRGVKAHRQASVSTQSESTRAYEAAMATMHQNMHASLSGDPDVDFVRQMIPHHQGAVEMATIQLKYGQDESLKRLCRWIIQAQEQEIGFMQLWLRRKDNGAVVTGAKDYYGEVMATMHQGMMIDYTGDADVDFVRGMIAHHQGAVDMAGIIFSDGSDPEINRLADGIHRSQTQEISWMKGWLEDHASK